MANAYLATLIAALNSADNDDLQKLRQALGGVEGERQTGLALLASIAISVAGGGAAVTIADGADVAEGAIADAAAANGGTGTASAKLRNISANLGTLLSRFSAGTARTLTSSTVTTGATISAGAKSVGATFSTDFAGTFNGSAIDPAQCPSKSVSVINPQDTLPAIPYTISAGTLFLDVLT